MRKSPVWTVEKFETNLKLMRRTARRRAASAWLPTACSSGQAARLISRPRAAGVVDHACGIAHDTYTSIIGAPGSVSHSPSGASAYRAARGHMAVSARACPSPGTLQPVYFADRTLEIKNKTVPDAHSFPLMGRERGGKKSSQSRYRREPGWLARIDDFMMRRDFLVPAGRFSPRAKRARAPCSREGGRPDERRRLLGGI